MTLLWYLPSGKLFSFIPRSAKNGLIREWGQSRQLLNQCRVFPYAVFHVIQKQSHGLFRIPGTTEHRLQFSEIRLCSAFGSVDQNWAAMNSTTAFNRNGIRPQLHAHTKLCSWHIPLLPQAQSCITLGLRYIFQNKSVFLFKKRGEKEYFHHTLLKMAPFFCTKR